MDIRARSVRFQTWKKGVGVAAIPEDKQRTEEHGAKEGENREEEVFSWRRKRFEGDTRL